MKSFNFSKNCALFVASKKRKMVEMTGTAPVSSEVTLDVYYHRLSSSTIKPGKRIRNDLKGYDRIYYPFFVRKYQKFKEGRSMDTRDALDRYILRFVAGQPALISEEKATFDYYAIARVEGARAFLKAARPLATRVLAVVVRIIDCGSHTHLPDSNRSMTNSLSRILYHPRRNKYSEKPREINI